MPLRVVLRPCVAAELELALGAVSAGDDAVHQDARVARQVAGLAGAPSHGEPELAVEEQRLHRAEAGRPVRPDGGDQDDAGTVQQSPPDRGEVRSLRFELAPLHGRSVGAPCSLVPTRQRRTTPHFDGHPSVLVRASRIGEISRQELVEVVQDAWLAQASPRRAAKWLESQGSG
jgi:hypothetical protein